MKKQILKIFVCSLILLIGIGAVNALDNNSTDEFISLEQGDVNIDEDIEFSYDNNEIEVLSAENIDDSDSCDEILGSQVENEDPIAVSDDEVLSADNGDEDVLAISNDEEALSAVVEENETEVLGSSEPPKDVPVYEPTITHSSNLKLDKFKYEDLSCKELVFAKAKISKKNYKRFVKKTPSKKNKKLWKKYKKFEKAVDKKLEKSMKKRIKAIKKKWKIDWYYGIRSIFVVKGKYCTINCVCMCYR